MSHGRDDEGEHSEASLVLREDYETRGRSVGRSPFVKPVPREDGRGRECSLDDVGYGPPKIGYPEIKALVQHAPLR